MDGGRDMMGTGGMGATLAEALGLAGAAGASGDAAIVFLRMPDDGGVARQLSFGGGRGRVVAGVAPEALAAHGRMVGEGDGSTFVAFRDAVVRLHRGPEDGSVMIRPVSSGPRAIAAASREELAALAGTRWVDDDEVAVLAGEPVHPGWGIMKGRVADAMAAFPAIPFASAQVGEPRRAGGPPHLTFELAGKTDHEAVRAARDVVHHAIQVMPAVGARRLREGWHRRLASSWEETPALGRVPHPCPAALASTVVAAATAGPARARTLAWLLAEDAPTDLVASLRALWATDGLGTGGPWAGKAA